MTIIDDRLALIHDLTLDQGAHEDPDDGMCAARDGLQPLALQRVDRMLAATGS
jgi:hypothetical protein